MKPTHRKWREEAERSIAGEIEEMKRDFPGSYKNMFSCYVFRHRPVEWMFVSTGNWSEQRLVTRGHLVWRVQVGTYIALDNKVSWSFAHFPFTPKGKDQAIAWAVSLVLKGLAFRIHYRKPR